MLIAIPMRIIPFFIIERIKPIIKPKGYASGSGAVCKQTIETSDLANMTLQKKRTT